MKIPNGFYRTSIKGLILDEKKRFLLCREDNDYWDFPGGAMDFGETPEETLRREIMEETGLVVTRMDKNPKYFLVFKNIKNFWSTQIVFVTEIKDLKITPSNECVEVRFFNKQTALKEKVFPSVVKFTEMFEKNERT